MLRGVYRHAGADASELAVVRRLRETADGSEQPAIQGAVAVARSRHASLATVGGITCTLDGALYNRADLAHELGLDGATDAELLARGYRRDGEKLLERLRGRFAFVLWDELRQRGLLGCDLLATKPLFLWRGVGYLAFADELPDLLSMLSGRPGPDPVRFLSWLGGWIGPAGRTLYEGISRLPPGHFIELSGEAPARSYWQPRYRGTLTGSRRELAEGLRSEIERAVARRLSRRSSGVVLSGGLDSSIVTAVASHVKDAGSELRTYSVVFPGADFDEAWKVRSLTTALGIEPSLLELEPQGALWLGLRHVQRWAQPLLASGSLIDIVCAEAAGHDGTEVVLDGQTGDELFGGSPWLLADHLLHGRVIAALRLTGEWPGKQPTWRQRLSILRRFGLKGAAPYRLHQFARRRKDPEDLSPAWLLPGLRAPYAALEDHWSWKAASGPMWWRYLADVLTQTLHRDLRLDYLRNRGADAGVVSETPLYDFDLIDFSLRLPPQLAYDSAFTRPLAREAVRGLVPDDVRLNGKKADFSSFSFAMLTGADAPGIESLLTAPDAELGAYADMERVRRLWRDERPSMSAGLGAAAWGSDVWRLAAAECWLRSQADPHFVDEMLAQPEVRPPEVRRVIE